MDFITILKKEYVVGLDIGYFSVKLVQFAEKKDGLRLMKADLKEIKHDGDEEFYEKEVISAIKDLLKGVNLKKSKFIATINCSQTAIKKIITPYMPKVELLEAIKLEMKNYFPFSTEHSIIDFEILKDKVEKGISRYELLIAVSPQQTVDRFLSLIGKMDIRPSSFVPSSYALQNLAGRIYHKQPDKTQCFIDIGEFHTELIICKGGKFIFSRRIPVTGHDFTKSLMAVLVSERGKIELTIEEAEKIKQEIGIPPETESKIIDNKISTTQILSMLRLPLEQLLSEIERSFDYYRQTPDGGDIDTVTIFGGTAYLGGFIKYLSEGLGIEVKLGDSLEGLTIEKHVGSNINKISHRLDLAIGAVFSKPKAINLLPSEFKEETARVIKRGILRSMLTAVIVTLLFIYIGMRIQLNNFQKKINVAKLELYSLQPALKQAEAQNRINRALANEPYWEDVFRELANLIPATVYITNIKMENNVMTMKGIIESKDREKILTDFIATLERGLFNSVKLVESKNLPEKMVTEFKLTCWLDYEN